MANLSIRGLDEKSLTELKQRAAREAASVNSLVLQLIEQGLGRRSAREPAPPAVRRSRRPRRPLEQGPGRSLRACRRAFRRSRSGAVELGVRPVLLDTNAYSAFMLGDTEIVEVIAHARHRR